MEFVDVKIPKPFYHTIEKYIHENPGLGYESVGEYVRCAATRHLEKKR